MQDEHELLIEYSEMTTFNFNSKEYKELRRDYLECKNFAEKFMDFVHGFCLDSINLLRGMYE